MRLKSDTLRSLHSRKSPQREAYFATEANFLPPHLGLDHRSGAVVEHDVFASIYNPGKIALLVGWETLKQQRRGRPKKSTAFKH